MFSRVLESLRCMVVVAAMGVLFSGCDDEKPPWYDGIHDLSGVEVSDDLAGHLNEGLATLETASTLAGPAADLVAYEDLMVRVRPLESRQSAGDEIYARWREEPTNVLWLELAKNYNFLLGRRDDLEAMCSTPGLDDPETPIGAYVAGRIRFRHGDRGEMFRRAEEGAAALDGLAQVWLQFKLSEVDNEEGDTLAGVHRILAILPQARAVGGHRLEAYGWHRASGLLRDADRLDDALHAATLAGALRRHTGSSYDLHQTLVQLAGIRGSRREYVRAHEDFLSLAEEASAKGYGWLERNALDKAASLASEQGQHGLALELDRRNLVLARNTGDPLNLPRMLVSVAYDHRMLGHMDSCYVYLQEAREQVEAYPDGRNVARMNSFLAEYYCQVGRYATADSLLALASGQSRTTGTANDEARILLELLPQALESGRPDLAYRWLARLDELAGSMHARGLAENLRADHQLFTLRLLARQGEFRRAAEALVRAEAAVAVAGGEGKEWAVSAAAGELALLRDDAEAAETAYRRCLDLTAGSTDPDLITRSRMQLGQVLLVRGRTEAARELFRPLDADATFGHRFSNRLHNMLLTGESYVIEGRSGEARDWFERALDLAGPHTPADLVARGELGLGRTLAGTGDPRGALVHLKRAQAALHKASGKSSLGDVAAYLSNSEREAREALVGLLMDHPDLAGPSGLGEATLAIARPEMVGRPSPGAGSPSLVHFIGGQRSFGWILTATEVRLQALPGEKELKAMVAPVMADMMTPGREIDGQAVARLSDLLLSAVARSWNEGAVLTVAPDGVLHGVPWSALPWPSPLGDGDGRVLLDHGPVVERVDQTVGSAKTRPTGELRLLAAGYDSRSSGSSGLPALRHAEGEARRVAALWPTDLSTVRLGEAATWDGLTALGLEGFGIIHLATHGSVHQGLPGHSTLRFAAGQETAPVTISAIAALDLNADLVYLSCCHAGRRVSVRGDGVADFAGAFLTAGVGTVVSSTIWVDDEAAAALAEGFYGHWLAGAGKAEALWAARRDVRAAREEWSHPAYWAFTRLMGATD